MFENQPALNPEQVQMLMAAMKKLQSESELPAELALQSGRHRR